MTTNMELQRIFTPQYVNLLSNNIHVEDYLKDEFPFDRSQVKRLKGIEHPSGLEQKMLKATTDFEAAVALYEAYKDIPPILASKDVLWTYLSHVDLFNYVKKKWPEYEYKQSANGKVKKNQQESERYIRDHWFYSRGPMRTSLMNLWWSVYLTIDNEADDEEHKYDLTRIFFLNDGMRTRRLGTGQLGRNREALKGILSFMKDHLSLFDQGGIENRMIWITRHFNFIGGAKPLGCMSSKFFYDELQSNLSHLKEIKVREDVQGPDAFV